MRVKANRKYDDCFYVETGYYYYHKPTLNTFLRTDIELLFEKEDRVEELTREEYVSMHEQSLIMQV